jgi:outer membrane protein assembly factor BamB
MSKRAAVYAAIWLSIGCRTISLNDDPLVPRRAANVTRPALFDVAWWQELVKPTLLEYVPLEPAELAVDPDSEVVFACTRDGFVRALAPADGRVIWEKNLKGRFFAGPLVSNGIVYAAGTNGRLSALRSATGELVWEYSAGEELVTTPVLAEGKVLVASQNETLFAVDQEKGTWVWQYRRDAPPGFTIRGVSRPTAHEKFVYMGFADGAVVALGLEDGVARWDRQVSTSGGRELLDVDTSPVVHDGRLYVASYKDGVMAMNAQTGEVEWSMSKPGITSILVFENRLWGLGDGNVHAVDTVSGRLLWSKDLSEKTSKGKGSNAGRSLMLTQGGILVVPTSTMLAFLDAKSGVVRSAWNPGSGVTSAPVRVASPHFGERLYVLSNGGSVFALELNQTIH